MAVSDIPEFIEVASGDLIRSADWNNLQRQTRNSIRSHRHTRVAGATASDTTSVDNALQIGSSEIANDAVTSAHLDNECVATANLQASSVTLAKLGITTVASFTETLSEGKITEHLVAEDVSESDVFFPPSLSIVKSREQTFSASIAYKQRASGETDAYVRLEGSGMVKCTVRYFKSVRREK